MNIYTFLCVLCMISLANGQIAPDINKVGVDGVKEWANERLVLAQFQYNATGNVRKPSPQTWSDKVVYQIMVDRFNNGDPSNDFLNIADKQRAFQNTSNEYGLPEYRHGGDIQGIIDRLDYLVDLGVNSLWITPVFQHDGQYHGYCTTDLTKIDVGFGSNELFRELVTQAHKRDIYVILDIVVNHLCDTSTMYSKRPLDHEACAGDLNSLYWNGQPGESSNQGLIGFAPSFFGPLKLQDFFSRCGTNSQADTSGTGPAAVFGDFVQGMFDYDTRNYDFQEIYTSILQYWIAFADIDGFRMDAAKHITEDFVAYFATHVREFALHNCSKDNFFVVGEVAADAEWEARRLGHMESNPSNPTQHGNVPQSLTYMLSNLESTYLSNPKAPYPGLNAIYDFNESGTSKGVLLGSQVTNALPNYYNSQDFRTISAQNDYSLSWTHLEIHDWPRFIHDDSNDAKKIMTGLTHLLTAPGQPIIYYGLEQGFNGVCNYNNIHAGQNANDDVVSICNEDTDACFRQDMFISSPWRLKSAVPAIDELNYIGKWNSSKSPFWQDDPFLLRNHNLYKVAKQLIALRKSCKAFTDNHNIYFRMSGAKRGDAYAFSRISATTFDEIVVIINPGLNTIPLVKLVVDDNINSSGERYINIFNRNQIAVTQESNGTMFLQFPAGFQVGNDDFVVFIKQSKLAFNGNVAYCK